jgi:hypothetical protein
MQLSGSEHVARASDAEFDDAFKGEFAGLTLDQESHLRAWYTLAKEQPPVSKRVLRNAQWGDRFLIEQRFNNQFGIFIPCYITRSVDQAFVFNRYDGLYIGQDGEQNKDTAVAAKVVNNPTHASLRVCARARPAAPFPRAFPCRASLLHSHHHHSSSVRAGARAAGRVGRGLIPLHASSLVLAKMAGA